jgi:lipoprotein-anchoring transpeptidase ErfK/SrfK
LIDIEPLGFDSMPKFVRFLSLILGCLVLAISSGFSMPSQALAAGGYFEPYEIRNTLRLGAGDILIDSSKKRLYFAYDDEVVMVFPVAVGREGVAWKGRARVDRMIEGPAWYPTPSQRKKRNLPERVPPGPGNPLGSHALYLYQGGKDTLIRIHGTNNPSSIGRAASDGCFRMRNEHIAQLFELVYRGATVTVL